MCLQTDYEKKQPTSGANGCPGKIGWRQKMKTINVRWNGETVEAYADSEGTVRVWDSVAGYWTTCHSLTVRQMQRVRRMARND